MEKNIVIKFNDYLTTEQTYKVNAEGVIEKQEWELYKDWHPAKFKVLNLTKDTDTTPFEKGKFVWIIKRNDNIVSVLSSQFDEIKVKEFFESLKGENDNNDAVDSNQSDNNENEDSSL